MKINLIIFFCIFHVSTVFGQKSVTNDFTAEHISVAGTKISLIPPQGFTKAIDFQGFQQESSGSSIMLLDLPGPFSETSKGFTKENFLSQGVQVQEIENLAINGLPAILVTGEQNAYGNEYIKFVLSFGTEKETIMINGAYPKNLKEIGKEIKSAILTAYYEPDKVISPFEIVDYSINTDEYGLKFTKSISSSLLFTVDGLIPGQSEDKTTFLVAKSFSKVPIADTKLFSINRLKKMPFEIENTESTEEISIDGISGYEIIAFTIDKKTAEKGKVYQVILFTDSLYYIMLGTTNKEYEKNIEKFKKIAHSFVRK